ncbi:MAG: hypothetical protein MZU97_18870 [Bacillus subtilis]|nr:hypothetical protein [Bacillus subtilis]
MDRSRPDAQLPKGEILTRIRIPLGGVESRAWRISSAFRGSTPASSGLFVVLARTDKAGPVRDPHHLRLRPGTEEAGDRVLPRPGRKSRSSPRDADSALGCLRVLLRPSGHSGNSPAARFLALGPQGIQPAQRGSLAVTKPREDCSCLPAPIGDGDPLRVLSPEVVEILRSLRHFVVESERSAGRLPIQDSSAGSPPGDSSLPGAGRAYGSEGRSAPPGARVGRDTTWESYPKPGCPCVADPGADLAAEAHRRGVTVVPLSGPSSVLQALMASGFSGQRFLFLGYIPARSLGDDRRPALRQRGAGGLCGTESTRIFIEAPYRESGRAWSDALAVLDPDTLFCVAAIPGDGRGAHPVGPGPERWHVRRIPSGKGAGGLPPGPEGGSQPRQVELPAKPLLLSDADESPLGTDAAPGFGAIATASPRHRADPRRRTRKTGCLTEARVPLQ